MRKFAVFVGVFACLSIEDQMMRFPICDGFRHKISCLLQVEVGEQLLGRMRGCVGRRCGKCTPQWTAVKRMQADVDREAFELESARLADQARILGVHVRNEAESLHLRLFVTSVEWLRVTSSREPVWVRGFPGIFEGVGASIQPQELVIMFGSVLRPASRRLGGGRVGPGVVSCLDQCDALAMHGAHAKLSLPCQSATTSDFTLVRGGGKGEMADQGRDEVAASRVSGGEVQG
jgi:hypothetical protein